MGWRQHEFSGALLAPNLAVSWHITDISQLLKSTHSTFYLILLFNHCFLEPPTCLVFPACSDRVLYFTVPGTSFCCKHASNKTDILDFSLIYYMLLISFSRPLAVLKACDSKIGEDHFFWNNNFWAQNSWGCRWRDHIHWQETDWSCTRGLDSLLGILFFPRKELWSIGTGCPGL